MTALITALETVRAARALYKDEGSEAALPDPARHNNRLKGSAHLGVDVDDALTLTEQTEVKKGAAFG